MSSATFTRRKAAGECVQCGVPLKGAPGIRCLRCRDQQKSYYGRGSGGQPLPPEEEEQDKSPRCPVCRLRLPCNACLPTARELAERRIYSE